MTKITKISTQFLANRIRKKLTPRSLGMGPDGCWLACCPSCCFCGSGCGSCADGASSAWTLTTSGITNASCPDCDTFNGTFTLNYVGSCQWATEEWVACTIGGAWVLRNPGGGYWELFPAVTPLATYSHILDADFNCCASNTFTFVSGGSCNWPATVTVDPTGDCRVFSGGVCASCCAAIPSTLYAHFSGGASGCEFWDGVVVTLTYEGSGQWAGSIDICVPPNVNEFMVLACIEGIWHLGFSTEDGGDMVAASASCSPVDIIFTGHDANNCCGLTGGTVDVEITEFP